MMALLTWVQSQKQQAHLNTCESQEKMIHLPFMAILMEVDGPKFIHILIAMNILEIPFLLLSPVIPIITMQTLASQSIISVLRLAMPIIKINTNLFNIRGALFHSTTL